MGGVSKILLRREIAQSLRPSRKSLAVFAAIILIVILYGMSYPKVVPCVIPACPQEQWIMLPWKFCPICSMGLLDYMTSALYYALFPVNFLESYVKNPNTAESVLLLLLQFSYWYVISCAIAWAYKKYRKSGHQI
jgi:hypothetical protein